MSDISIDFSTCNKNIVNDPSVYSKFEKTCSNNLTTTKFTPQDSTLIYCPEDREAGIDSSGNIYCTLKNNEKQFSCLPKYNPFSVSDLSGDSLSVCTDYCNSETSFFVSGNPYLIVGSQSDCAKECEKYGNCTGYTYYHDTIASDNRCILYSLKQDEYSKYAIQNSKIKGNSDPKTYTATSVKEINGFPCHSEFTNYKQTGDDTELNNCIKTNFNTTDVETTLKLIDAVKDLSCQYSACITEYKKDDGDINFFKNANSLGGEVSYYLNNGEYKDYLKILYIISGIIVFWMILRFFLYKIVGGFGDKNKYNIFKAFFGNNNKSSIWAFIIPSLFTALSTVVSLSIGKFGPAIYTTIVCTTVLILLLAVINILLTMRGFTNWKGPGGLQQIFMIIIVVVSLALSIYFLYESIKDRDYGSSPIESEAPFIVIPKIHNYGYIALLVTAIVGVIALLVIVKELFSNMKTAQYSGSNMSVKSNTMGIGIIASALYGIFGGLNLVLAVFAPFLLLTFAIFERIFGAIITKSSNSEGYLQNLMINIGKEIYNQSTTGRSRKFGKVENEFLKIGQEFFGGGPSNGWAPFGTTFLNIILGMMTNYNYVLSRTEILETKTSGRFNEAVMPSSIRVLDKEMWFTTGYDITAQKRTSKWFSEINNRSS